MIVSLIVAAAENDVIGKTNGLPWHLPDEMRHFKEVTLGKPVIMGRKTYDSIGRPLPKRRNIIITRDPSVAIDGVDVVTTVQQAIEVARQDGAVEAIVIGGAQIYAAALPFVDRLYFTRVHADVEGDVQLAPIDWSEWEKVSAKEHPADEKHAHAFTMEVWEKKKYEGVSMKG